MDKLIAAVEAGQKPSFPKIARCVGGDNAQDVEMAFEGKLDAALRLHEALLPGFGWQVWRTLDHLPDGASRPMYGCNLPMTDTAYAETPARAWLLAILRALKAQGGDA